MNPILWMVLLFQSLNPVFVDAKAPLAFPMVSPFHHHFALTHHLWRLTLLDWPHISGPRLLSPSSLMKHERLPGKKDACTDPKAPLKYETTDWANPFPTGSQLKFQLATRWRPILSLKFATKLAQIYVYIYICVCSIYIYISYKYHL